jgi:quercetin dioxygenase-like cupin family protein
MVRIEMAKVFQYGTVQAKDVDVDGASKVKVRWLLTKEMGAINFAMRVFEIEPEGYTPLHTHPWEHEIFILEGEGQLFDGKKETLLRAGDAVFVKPDERHQFKNRAKELFKFICLIPYTKE